MILLSSAVLAVLCVCICFSVIRGKISARQVLTSLCRAVLFVACAALLGLLMSLIPFAGIWARVAYYATLAVVLASVVLVYIAGEKRAIRLATATSLRASAAANAAVRNARGWLYGASVATVLAAALLLAIGQPFYLIMIPVAIVALVLLIAGLLRWRIWYALGAIAIIAYAVMALLESFVAAEPASLAPVAAAVAVAGLITSSFGTLTIRK